jgi:putative ABC transport system permease protein
VSGFASLRDLRFAIKALRRAPGFTLIAIITLGLGIGANTSMFSVLNGYMLRPTPYPNSDGLDRIYRNTRQNPRGGISPADYLDIKSEMTGYGEIAGYVRSQLSVADAGASAEMASGLRVSGNLFLTLGVTPQLGRSFRPDEEILGNATIAS